MKAIIRLASLALLATTGLIACNGGDDETDTLSADHFLSNQMLQKAIKESGWTYTTGSSPPSIVGKYEAFAEFTKANPSSIAGATAETVYCYYNQTSTSVDSLETAPDIDPTYQSRGPGLLVTGEGSSFTVWKDARSTSSSCTQRTFVLFNGEIDADKHLRGEFLTVVIEVTAGCGDVQPGWWRMAPAADFAPAGTCSG